jgi:DnaJ-class molecular chaperone
MTGDQDEGIGEVEPQPLCKPCKGSGRLQYEITNHGERNELVMDTCRYCKGTGRVPR